MSELADKLFNGDQNALRGFLIIRADEEINSIKKDEDPFLQTKSITEKSGNYWFKNLNPTYFL